MLEFEYCECGCKGSSSLEIGGISFWIHDSLKGPVYLHRGHGWTSPKVKDCTSYEEAVQVATEEARVLLDKEQEKLDEIRRQVNAKPPKVLSFEQEVRTQFPGNENAGIRRVLRETHNSREIRLMAKSIAFTELGRTKLEIVAEAADRPVRK